MFLLNNNIYLYNNNYYFYNNKCILYFYYNTLSINNKYLCNKYISLFNNIIFRV